jgi:putative membrane protein
LLGVALPLIIATAAFAADVDKPGHKSPAPGTANDTMSAIKDTAGGAIGLISAEMTSTTKGFVTAAATSDMYEVEAGKIAQERGQSAGVRISPPRW